MQKFTVHAGTAVPLRRTNVDTDQIIPAVYLKRIARTGFEDGLFAAWRTDPDFVLNDSRYAEASILLAGQDFGTGSSREHAVWALCDYGFKAVISPRFGDIFANNAAKSGLLAAVVEAEDVQRLWTAVEDNAQTLLTIDLRDKRISADNLEISFQVDDYTRWRLLEGLDDIDITLSHEDEISTHEGKIRSFTPLTKTP